IWPKLTTPEERLADMDKAGVDLQVISPSPAQYYYWADRDAAEHIAKLCNENIADVCAKYPTRFKGLGNVSLQHPDLACAQLEHAVKKLGFAGVEISSTIHGAELNDPRFNTFWAKAEALNAVVFIHPLGSSLGTRVVPYFLSNTIGQPLETTIALSMMIFSGLFDRHPALKIIAAHGGGYLPLYAGRSDHAHYVRPEAMQCKHPPSHYLKHIWHDTVVYHAQALTHLIDAVGAAQVVLGSDYPFDMAESDPLSLLSAIEGLSDEDCAAILGGNATKLLSLSEH
ncbi:MAG: amidohydrolase, partial [Rhodospirillaceae bacterium]|nr:amidohydrolase [Rhodospirillaceae bacterium]